MSDLRNFCGAQVSEILGHSDVHTTMKIYQRTNTEAFRGPLDNMLEALFPDVTNVH
jgi:integrase